MNVGDGMILAVLSVLLPIVFGRFSGTTGSIAKLMSRPVFVFLIFCSSGKIQLRTYSF